MDDPALLMAMTPAVLSAALVMMGFALLVTKTTKGDE